MCSPEESKELKAGPGVEIMEVNLGPTRARVRLQTRRLLEQEAACEVTRKPTVGCCLLMLTALCDP